MLSTPNHENKNNTFALHLEKKEIRTKMLYRKFLTVLLLCITIASYAQQKARWIGTWACAQQPVDKHFMPYNNQMTNRSVRQIVKVSIGGRLIRLLLSNELSAEPLEITSIYVAKAKEEYKIEPLTARYFSFHGKKGVHIAAGRAIFTDALKFDLKPLEKLSITINYRKAPKSPTVHMGSRTTSYILKGTSNPMTNFASALKENHWFNISSIEVYDKDVAAIAILGNSITDGKGSTINAQDRWPDRMSETLNNTKEYNLLKSGRMGILNLGIGNNRILSVGLGIPGKDRFNRDILTQHGLSSVIIFEAINDIGTSKNPEETAQLLITEYEKMIIKAHERGLKVYGGTITPFKGCKGYYTEEREKCRKTVNEWIRSSGKYDGIIDFDQLLCDPASPEQLRKDLHIGDWLHPNAAGYKLMGEYAAKKILQFEESKKTEVTHIKKIKDKPLLSNR